MKLNSLIKKNIGEGRYLNYSVIMYSCCYSFRVTYRNPPSNSEVYSFQNSRWRSASFYSGPQKKSLSSEEEVERGLFDCFLANKQLA